VKLLELRSIARRKEVSLTEDAVIGALEKSTKKGLGERARSERSNVGERFQAPFRRPSYLAATISDSDFRPMCNMATQIWQQRSHVYMIRCTSDFVLSAYSDNIL
jgi:hypothetical protein